MSEMYRAEVPQYGTLIELVSEHNAALLATDATLSKQLQASGDLERLDVERHGAIRLGTAAELVAIRRLFAVMGMHPVGYYDLSVAGLPVHSTAFRPIEPASLRRNPFRVFCSLLRLDLLTDRDLAATAAGLLAQRQIVNDTALALIEKAEADGGLGTADADAFVSAALETFRWHAEATVDAATYARLKEAHGLVADVVSFKGPHINHLTLRTLDIDAVQQAMPQHGIAAKAVIEGPPRRETPILLRQTAFKALKEPVAFVGNGAAVPGTHTARFGEIEQRGAALTPAGRARYDACLARTAAATSVGPEGGTPDYMTVLAAEFAGFPDTTDALRREGLAYLRYQAAAGAQDRAFDSLEALLVAGLLSAELQTYEDFLPVSAAGIFRSNLGAQRPAIAANSGDRAAFETALGVAVIDADTLYAQAEHESLARALAVLNQEHLMPAP